MATAPVTVPIGMQAVPIPPFPKTTAPSSITPAPTPESSPLRYWPLIAGAAAAALVIAVLWRK